MELSLDLLTSLAKTQDVRLQYCLAAYEIARRAADEIVKPALEIKRSYTSKDRSVDLVTETDQKVEKLVCSFLKERFPSHKFIGEETVHETGECELTEEPTWMVDPIDGTTSFVHGIPYYAISIALTINKRPQVGVVYAVSLNEIYVGVEGHGSYLGNQRLKVTGQKHINGSMVLTEWGAWREASKLEYISNNIKTVIGKTNGPANGLRSLGSSALNVCLVGRGNADVYYERGPKCWDIAAGTVIAREAGAIIKNFEGDTHDVMRKDIVCAASQELFDEVRKCIDKTRL